MNERARIDAEKVIKARAGNDRVEVIEAAPPRRYTVPKADEQVTPHVSWRKFPGRDRQGDAPSALLLLPGLPQ